MHLDLAREHRYRGTDPLRRRSALRRRRLRRGVYLLPSMFTLANMFCGYACVVFAMQGKYETAAPFVAFAIVLDALDGRIARLTGTTSAFGLEFDSLADVISFGVAPAILTFAWGLAPLGRLGWAAGFIFVTAGAIRLARFNIQTSTDKRYFVGMPIPAAAGVPAATVFLFPTPLPDYRSALPALALMIIPAILMVSTIKFRSFKTIDLQARRSYTILLLLALGLVAIATHPRWTLLVMAYTYLLSAFVGLAMNRLKRKKGDPAGPAASGERRAAGEERNATGEDPPPAREGE